MSEGRYEWSVSTVDGVGNLLQRKRQGDEAWTGVCQVDDRDLALQMSRDLNRVQRTGPVALGPGQERRRPGFPREVAPTGLTPEDAPA